MASSNAPDSSTSTTGSAAPVEKLSLDLDALPMPTPEVAALLERLRPGRVTYEEYFLFLKQFHWSAERLRAIPLSTGPRFTLD